MFIHCNRMCGDDQLNIQVNAPFPRGVYYRKLTILVSSYTISSLRDFTTCVSSRIQRRGRDRGTRIIYVHLLCTSCTGANLKGAQFDNSQMNGAILRLASLKGASLKSCNLRYSVMAGTDLEVSTSKENSRGCVVGDMVEAN